MHSLGFGFTVADGVTASVRTGMGGGIRFNGREIEFPTVASVVAELAGEPVSVELETNLPISSGFGLSGAAALATAYATNALLGLGQTERELALRVHVSEVRHLTGLGDVCGQFFGGCLVKLKEGEPLEAERLEVGEPEIYYRYFGPIHTRDVLGNAARRQRINAAADAALAEMARCRGGGAVEFDACVRTARRFASESGLLEDIRVRETIEGIERLGYAASMIMLGNAVFSPFRFPGSYRTRLSSRPARCLTEESGIPGELS